MANLYVNLGKYYEKSAMIEQAIGYYQLAIRTLFQDFHPETEYSNPKLDDIVPSIEAVEAIKAKAEGLFKLYKHNHKIEALDASINTNMLVISMIENLKDSYLTYESKLALVASEDETFKNAMAFTDEAYRNTKDNKYIIPLFDISEKNKSSLLLSSIRELEAKNFGNIPLKILAEEKYLSKRIEFFKEQIYEEKQEPKADSIKILNWENSLFQVQNEHIKLINKFETDYPNYYALKYNNKTLDINQLQTKIPRKRSIIEYTLTDSILYIFSISNRSVHYCTKKIDSSFYKLIKDYLAEYQNFDFSRQFYSKFTEFCWQSKELYNILIQPIESFIKNKE